jgi:SAM-dependent methyltransferase
MKIFRFTAEEINKHKFDEKIWGNFVRSREAEIIFSQFPNRRFHHALELGAGDGGQSVSLARYCDKLVCTDINWNSNLLSRKTPNVDYMLCDAQDLSIFPDDTFDLVFSSNMLEHIPNVDRCLMECKRVLTTDGLMLHLMPSRWWKLFNTGFGILKLRRPGIHGASTSIWREFYEFGVSIWKKRIQSNGLRIVDIIGMPFYIGLGPSFIPIILLGNALSLPSSFLYIISKNT